MTSLVRTCPTLKMKPPSSLRHKEEPGETEDIITEDGIDQEE
jgi:hypothetical protein